MKFDWFDQQKCFSPYSSLLDFKGINHLTFQYFITYAVTFFQEILPRKPLQQNNVSLTTNLNSSTFPD